MSATTDLLDAAPIRHPGGGADAAAAPASAPRPALRAAGVGKVFHRRKEEVVALAGVDLTIETGTFVTIVGRSGCGKSTLLRLLAGLNGPSTGEIELDGQPVTGPPDGARCVFQDYGQSLLPWQTIEQNVRLGVRHSSVPAKRSRAQQRREAADALDSVGLGHAIGRYPWELSGGMQQRVAIARALAARPRVLFMDEPFSSVDALSRAQLQDTVLSVWSRLANTVVLVTHDIDEAVYLSDRVIVLDEHGKGVLAEVAVDLPRPRHQLTTREAPAFLEARREITRLVLG